jgi:hypothetical protein
MGSSPFDIFLPGHLVTGRGDLGLYNNASTGLVYTTGC